MPRPLVDHAPLADRSSGQYEIRPAVCCWAPIQRGRGDTPGCIRGHSRRRPSGARAVVAFPKEERLRMVVPQRVAREVLGPPAAGHELGRTG